MRTSNTRRLSTVTYKVYTYYTPTDPIIRMADVAVIPRPGRSSWQILLFGLAVHSSNSSLILISERGWLTHDPTSPTTSISRNTYIYIHIYNLLRSWRHVLFWRKSCIKGETIGNEKKSQIFQGHWSINPFPIFIHTYETEGGLRAPTHRTEEFNK